MNSKLLAALLITSATLVSGFAHAEAAPLTRAQVKAELYEAIRTGDMEGSTVTHQKLNEMFPNRYPLKSMAPLKSSVQLAQKNNSDSSVKQH